MEGNFTFSEQDFTAVLTNDAFLEKVALNQIIKEVLLTPYAGNIVIISYKTENREIKKNIEIWMKHEFENTTNMDKIKILDPIEKNIFNFLSNIDINKNDTFIIIGGERLCTFNAFENARIEKKVNDTKVRIFSPEQLDISGKINDLKEKRRDFEEEIYKFIILFSTSFNKAKEVAEKFVDKQDIEVSLMLNENTNPKNIDLETLFKEISEKKLSSGLDHVESLKEILDPNTISMLKFAVYISKGFKEEALGILRENYSSLDSSFVIIYASFLNSTENYQEAYAILYPLFQKDRWIPGIKSALLISSRFLSFKKREELINAVLIRNEDNFVFQECLWHSKNVVFGS